MVGGCGCKVKFLILLLTFGRVHGIFNSSIFWSYYTKASVDRSHVIGDGYERDNPLVWIGDNILHSSDDNQDQDTIDDEDAIVNDDILILGSLSKISHGPRKKRDIYKVYTYPGSEAAKIGEQKKVHQEFRDFLSLWPVKEKHAINKKKQSRTDLNKVYDEHNKKFFKTQTSQMETFSRNYCRHACENGDPSVPCCPKNPGVLSIGPLVQPTLFENWVTGVFEFAANNPIVFTFLKAVTGVGIFGLMILIWGAIGRRFGFISIPEGRFFSSVQEFNDEERIVLEVINGNWLTTLEEHVKNQSQFSNLTHFYCCVSTREDITMLECFPHRTKTIISEPNFSCKSSLKYDISLNSKSYKPIEQFL